SLSHQDVLPHLDKSAQVGLELALGEALVPAPAHHVRGKIPDPLDERRIEDGYGPRRVNGFSQPATCSLRSGRPYDYGSTGRPAPPLPPPTPPLAADGDELLVGVHRRPSPRVVLEVQVIRPPLGVAGIAHVADLGSCGDERPGADTGVLVHVRVVRVVAVLRVHVSRVPS